MGQLPSGNQISKSGAGVLTTLAVIAIAGVALVAFAFFAVIGVFLLAALFLVGAVVSLFSRGRRSRANLHGSRGSGRFRVTVIGRNSEVFDAAPHTGTDVLEGEVIDEHVVEIDEASEHDSEGN